MAVRKPPNPWSEKQVEIGIAVVLLAAGTWFRLPGVGAYLAAAVFIRFGWPKPEEIYDLEGPGFTNAGKAQLYAAHLMQPLGAKAWFGAVGPDGNTWWPPTRISAWWALLVGLTAGLAELLVMASTGIAMPYFAIDTLAVFLLAQAVAAGSRDAAYADFQMQGTFPAAVIDADVVGRLGTTKIIWAPLATAIAIAIVGTIATLRVASGIDGFGLPLPIVATAWVAIGLLTGASIGARRYIVEFAAPQREFLTNAQLWSERWMSVRLGQVPPPQYAGEFTQPPEGNGEETHKMAIFQVPAGGTIAKYKDKTEELMSAVATEPGTGKYVLVAPMPDTDPAGQPIPGSRNEQQFKVVWNTVPLPAEPHLAGDLDNWTLAYAIHQAFDRAFNALKLGMPDLVRPIPLVRTPDRALFETIWNLPQGTTYEKVMKQAEGIAEKIDAPWLRIGRRTHDSDGRVLPDTAISICFGHHPDTVEVDPRTRAFLESLDLHAAFYALKLGAPVLEEAVRLTKPGRPAITEAKFRLSASIDWAAVSKKTAALAEKIEVDYLRITRRDDPSGNPSPLVSVIYGCHPSDTVMLGDPAGYDPDEPLVGPETNSDRLFLDALDWDDYFRACGLVGSDRRSPAVISKTVNKQGVASYECRTVPGLPISDLVDGVEALKATSGLGYVEIESHPKDAALFKLLAAKIDPLDRPYLAVDYANGPKPHTNTTVLHAPVPGVPDIDWAVGPGAEGDLLIDKWEGDNPHLFIGGASGSGKSITTLWMLLQLMHNNDPADVKFALADPKTELVYFEDAAHVNHFLGLTTPGFMANPYGAMADLLEHLKEETYRRNQSFTMHPAKPQKLTQARFIARQEIAHAHAGTVPDYWPAATAFPWWDGPPEAHPFMLPYQFIIIEECSTFFKKPANKEQHGDWERLIGHVEEMARIARSAGMHIAAMTQYPKKENIPTTLLAQCRRIGLSMNRIGSMLTIEESGLQDIKTPGRGKMSYGKSYKGVRCLFVRAPDEKDPDAPNDRDMFFEPVPKDGKGRVEVGGRLPGTTGPTVVAAAPPDPSGVWLPTGGRSVMPGAVAPTVAAGPVGDRRDGGHVESPDWGRPDEEYPDLDDLLADLG